MSGLREMCRVMCEIRSLTQQVRRGDIPLPLWSLRRTVSRETRRSLQKTPAVTTSQRVGLPRLHFERLRWAL